MRGLRKAIGVGLILLGSSGLALTAMVAHEPEASEAPDPADAESALESQAPSLDAWAMGLVFAGVTATGVWAYRTPRR